MNRLALERPNICVLRGKGITLRDLSKKLFDRGMGSTVFTRKKSHGRKLAQKAGRDDRLRMDGIQNWKRNIRVGKHPDDKLVDDLIKLLIKRRFLFEFLSSGNLSFSDSAQFDIQYMSSKGDQVGLKV